MMVRVLGLVVATIAILVPGRPVDAGEPFVLPPLGRRDLGRLLHGALEGSLAPSEWRAIEDAHDRFRRATRERALDAVRSRPMFDFLPADERLARTREAIERDRAFARAERALFTELVGIAPTHAAAVEAAGVARRLDRARAFVFHGLHGARVDGVEAVALEYPHDVVRQASLDAATARAVRPSIRAALGRLVGPTVALRGRVEAIAIASLEHDVLVERRRAEIDAPGGPTPAEIEAATIEKRAMLEPLVEEYRRALAAVRVELAAWLEAARPHLAPREHRRLTVMTICERWRAESWLDAEPIVDAWMRTLPDEAPSTREVRAAIEAWGAEAVATAHALRVAPREDDSAAPTHLDDGRALLAALRAIASADDDAELAARVDALESPHWGGIAPAPAFSEPADPITYEPGGIANARAVSARTGDWTYARRSGTPRGDAISAALATAFDLRRTHAVRVHLDHRTPLRPLAPSDLAAIPGGDVLLDGDSAVVSMLFADYRAAWNRDVAPLDERIRALEDGVADSDPDGTAMFVERARIDQVASARRRLLAAIAGLEDALVADLAGLLPDRVDATPHAMDAARLGALVAFEVATFRAFATLPPESDDWRIGPRTFSPIAALVVVHDASPDATERAASELLRLRDPTLRQLRTVVGWDYGRDALVARLRDLHARGGPLQGTRGLVDRTPFEETHARLTERRTASIDSWDRTRDEIESTLLALVPPAGRDELRTTFVLLDRPDLFDPRLSWIPLLRAVERADDLTRAERDAVARIRDAHRRAVVAIGRERLDAERRHRPRIVAELGPTVDGATARRREDIRLAYRYDRAELDDRVLVALAALLGDERARAYPELDGVEAPRVGGD